MNYMDTARALAYALKTKCVESEQEAMDSFIELVDDMTDEEHIGFWRTVDILKGDS